MRKPTSTKSSSLGSASTAINEAGTVVSSRKHYPYGRAREVVEAMPTDKLFTGHQEELDDLYFTQARFYDPAIGRFLQADSVVPDPANPQALNRYSYVYNTPLRYTDPTGHWVEDLPEAQLRTGCGLMSIGVVICDSDLQETTEPPPPPPFPDAQEIWEYQQLYVSDGPGPQALRPIADTIIGFLPIVGELCDGAVLGAGRSCTWLETPRYAGLALFIPGLSAGLLRGLDNELRVLVRGSDSARVVKEGFGSLYGGSTSLENALTAAERWLGEGYKEIAPGVFRSADDARQFRITTRDFTVSPHGTHVHFEAIAPDGREVVENAHLKIEE